MSVPLSVVMPVYNEQDAIMAAVDEVQQHVLRAIPGSELVVVNDGSRDGTGALLDQAAARNPRIRVIHQPNAGHGGALLAGIGAARGDHIFLIDSDRQIPLDEFSSAWAAVIAGRDAVFGVRRRRHDPAIRLYLSALIKQTLRALFGVELEDANVPYKLFRRRVWEDARPMIPDGTLAPSLFLAIVTRHRRYNLLEVDVVHKERHTGEVSIRSFKLLKFCARAFVQLLELRRRLARGSGQAKADAR